MSPKLTDTVVWKEFEANEITHSAAHHLTAIDEVGRQYGGWARVSDIARHLNITRGSVSINLRSITARGLVEQGEHHLVRLTPTGLRIVQALHAKKAILHAFFRDILGRTDAQAEVDSCKMEHLLSNGTAQELLRFLHFFFSEQPAAVEAKKRFQQFKDQCPDPQTCPVCNAAAQSEGRAGETISLAEHLPLTSGIPHERIKRRTVA